MTYIIAPNGRFSRFAEAGNIEFSSTVFQPADTLSDEQKAGFGVFLLTEVAPPSFNPATQKAVAGDPAPVDGVWSQVWSIVDLSSDEIAAYQARLQQTIANAVQDRLDTFARTRGYDSILSATTYRSSSVAQFATEGQYCVDQRDATWAALYALLAEVQAGTKPVPSGYADVEPILPALAWP